MGFHKKLRELDPLVYYTFDPRETYGNIYYGIGDYGNKVETEFPNLHMYNTGLMWVYENIAFIQPSLANIENSSLYKASSNGAPKLYNALATNLKNVNKNFTFNDSSMYYESELSDENVEELNSNNGYTIFFQVEAEQINGYSSILYTNAFKEYLEPRVHFGFNIYCPLSTTSQLGTNIENRFGFIAKLMEENTVEASFCFGAEMKFELLVDNIVDPNKPLIIPNAILFYSDISYTSSIMDITYFSFGKLRMRVTTTSTNYTISFEEMYNYQNSYQLLTITETKDKPINLFIEVNEQTNRYKFYNGKVYIGEYALKNNGTSINYTKKISLGYKCRWEKHDVEQSKVSIFTLDEHTYLRRCHFPQAVVSFDNFAMYNYIISDTEKTKLFDSDKTQIDFYAEKNFNQLYNFAGLYNRKRFYLQNGTSIPNIFGTSYLNLYVSDKNELPYVTVHEADPRIDYSLELKSNASLMTDRNSNTFRPITLLNNASGTLTFSFKTTDNDGVLFFSGKYEHSTRNLMMSFSYGFLEIWHSNEIYSRVAGLNNGEWHIVDILYTSSTLKISINNIEYINRKVGLANEESMVGFGNCLPGNNGLNVELAMIGFSTATLDEKNLNELRSNSLIYSAAGQVTLNNIAMGTVVFIYNRNTGALVERLTTSNENGNFTYYNKTPYILTIIVADSSLTQGTSYIVDPIELQ